jgi:hypothetical protein
MTPEAGGLSPFDALMTELGLSNADLVNVSTEQLTFKAVAKARKGKPLSVNMRRKVLGALRIARPGRTFSANEIFARINSPSCKS